MSQPLPRDLERGPTWDFVLYVAGESVRGRVALQNLREVCEEFLPGRHTIEVVDLGAHPDRAARDQIVASPTLVRRQPPPRRTLIGDLSNRARLLSGLELGH